MKSKALKLLKIIVPIAIGIYLTWYFFSGMTALELQDTKDAFFDANYFWIVISLLIAWAGHLSRAYRWLFLLEPLGYNPKLVNAYHAVMAGYVINYTVPRSGEIARAGLMTSYEQIPFEKGFATIIIERMIDVIMLGSIVFITGVLQSNSSDFNSIMESNQEGSGNLKWYILAGVILAGCIGFIFYLTNEKLQAFANAKLKGFWEGLKTVWTMKKKWAFIFHTLFIWSSYIGMIWASCMAFPETADLPIEAILGAFVVGAAAVALFPGGIGAYPMWVTQVLLIYGVTFKGFGIYIWVVQTSLLIILGLLSLFLIQRQPKRIQRK
ncbi:MAG: lysylphosphatidylglycerol synthase transmembrane domain-containing protein [Crocinitomicaceae bacterium]|nr:lysylphosphatidylglycerol synthase transmembrane domain-containing protein [Crocinitomicaceae bacterium]